MTARIVSPATLVECRLARLDGLNGKRKEALAGLWTEWGKPSIDLSFKVTDDALEIGLVEDWFALGGTEKESVAAKVVDLASDTLGVIVDEGQEAIGENGVPPTGDAEMMLDVGGSLLEVEGFEVVADGDALVEGLEGGKAKLVGQVRLAEKDEGEQGGGIHLVVEQKTELVEDVVREQVRFVDDEEDRAALAGQFGERGAQLREQAGEAKSGLGLEGEQDLVIEGGGR